VTGVVEGAAGAAVAPFAEERAPEAAAHEEDLQRLRFVVHLGLVLWVVVGIPNDWNVARLHDDVAVLDMLVPRLISGAVLGLCALVLTRRPGPIGLRSVEILAFTTASGAQGVFAACNYGFSSPDVNFAVAVLIAQGLSLPRPWRQMMPRVGLTAAAWPAGLLLAMYARGTLDGAFASEHERGQLFLSMWTLYVSWALVIIGGHSHWEVRRQAFEARRVGRYQLKRRIGQGAMGEVWLAWHPGLRQDVALKVLRGLRVNEASARRFATEIAAATRLQHPHSVRVFDQGRTEAGMWYLAMELIDGVTLDALIERDGPLPHRRVERLLGQAARALAEAHREGIVHRDLKPQNVLVTTLGGEADVVKVVDYGMARLVEVEATASEDDPEDAGVAASPWFAAPEQLDGRLVDSRADVFALGALAFYLLTGRSPYAVGGDALGALDRVLRDDHLWPLDCPAPLRRRVRRCLHPRPSERYPDAGALVADVS
jgi:serine/threonine-protein kinase